MVTMRTEPAVPPADAVDKADLRAAYERGRQDERAARKRHPVFMTFLFVAAIVGVIVLGLAAWNGSFGTAGGVVDQNLQTAAERAEPAVRGAASDASQTVRDAAQSARDAATTKR